MTADVISFATLPLNLRS